MQGIQSFIFQTNALKEIVGASALVEKICTGLFVGLLEKNSVGGEPIVNAAGNIKYIFDDDAKCREIFLNFPRLVMEKAPGITISQAVVQMEEDSPIADSMELLEKRLRECRNMPAQSLTLGFMGVQRSRETGLPERFHPEHPDLFRDEGSYCKITSSDSIQLWEKSTGISDGNILKRLACSFDFTGENDWIAVVHADGNGLGQVVKYLGEHSLDGKSLSRFSALLDESTQKAARKAVNDVLMPCTAKGRYPYRPIVIGGDDLTVIIRGDLAIPFVKSYLSEFERQTKLNFAQMTEFSEVLGDGLTACAGISFVKSSFPYYYAYNLAEELCSKAKDDSGRSKSCLMFHKVHDSFVSSYRDIVRRELTAPDKSSFVYGPYFLKENDGCWTIDDLNNMVERLESEEGNALKSGIRKWMSLMMSKGGTAHAQQHLARMKDINKSMSSTIDRLTSPRSCSGNRYPAYDVLSLFSVNYQKTK